MCFFVALEPCAHRLMGRCLTADGASAVPSLAAQVRVLRDPGHDIRGPAAHPLEPGQAEGVPAGDQGHPGDGQGEVG